MIPKKEEPVPVPMVKWAYAGGTGFTTDELVGKFSLHRYSCGHWSRVKETS